MTSTMYCFPLIQNTKLVIERWNTHPKKERKSSSFMSRKITVTGVTGKINVTSTIYSAVQVRGLGYRLVGYSDSNFGKMIITIDLKRSFCRAC